MEHSQGTTEAGLLLAGRYRLRESIGRGGMGKVWRADDEVLGRVVAVKELTAGRYASEADRAVLHARTKKEARAAARISDPGVVTVHDVLDHDDRPWIVMQYVDGPSLADAAKETGRIEASEAARVGLQVLRALGAAHAVGVLHRDVKPGNVLLGRDGRVLITDFGIAAIEGDATITRTGEIVGSIDYLAPERVRGHDPGPASDLWSLGATLYTAVEGESPFRRSSPLGTMQAVVDEEAPPPQHAGLLAPVITALLCKDPAARPSAAEAERMLEDALEGRTTTAMSQSATHRFTTGFPGGTARDLAHYATHGPARNPAARAADAGTPLHGTAFQGARPPETPAHTPAMAPYPAADRPRRSGRLRGVVLVVVLAALVGGGAGLAVMKYADAFGGTGAGGDGAGRQTAGSSAGPQDSPGAREAVNSAEWRRVQDPEGFSLLVPQGWQRQLDGDQIDYTPDNGRHRIRISIEATPDFENPYMHMLSMEKGLQKRLPDYRRMKLDQNTFRDQTLSAIWEFTWTEKQNHPGPRRAIDQMYYGDDGTEYALYMSGPADDWETTRQQFDVMVQSWRPPQATKE
ncbi:serine/threonine-protein kinase [Streptomyces sp. MUM 178J]|uniref:serine/threonine-protein kinase n=1 Tax=Streptomyces sp. MUM 178J TaxID=2791991 RepID=UPI001F03D72B|nr:serine/threonine-protein kinase [Streptomyces sp. MUM 178J]WRQ81850.1 serine/threonine-protein kinase [Streptomyces sp. MUM 178J]